MLNYAIIGEGAAQTTVQKLKALDASKHNIERLDENGLLHLIRNSLDEPERSKQPEVGSLKEQELDIPMDVPGEYEKVACEPYLAPAPAPSSKKKKKAQTPAPAPQTSGGGDMNKAAAAVQMLLAHEGAKQPKDVIESLASCLPRPTPSLVRQMRQTNLLALARKGMVKEVVRCLDDGADINSTDAKGFSALIHASQQGYVEVVQTLLARKADPNQGSTDKDQLTPLLAACQAGHRDCGEALLVFGALLEARSGCNHTPLLSAAVNGKLEVLEMLLQRRADVGARDNQGRTPLMLAAFMGFHASVSALIKGGAALEERCIAQRTPLLWALTSPKACAVDCVQVLIEHGCDMEATCPMPPGSEDKRVGYADKDFVKNSGGKLIERTIAERRRLSALSAEAGKGAAAAAVLAKDDEIRVAKAAKQPKDVIMSIVEELKALKTEYEKVAGEPPAPTTKICCMLCSDYGEGSLQGMGTFYIEVEGNDTIGNVKINIREKRCMPPDIELHLEISVKHEDGSWTTHQLDNGRTARSYFLGSALYKLTAVVHRPTPLRFVEHKLVSHATQGMLTEMLWCLDHGCTYINYTDGNGFSALVYASQEGHTEVVQTLLHRKADPNLPSADKDQLTPLLAACQAGHRDCGEALLVFGALLEARSGC
eukprot:COSAG01_NODE_7902_length_3000_cov_2.894174_2_plen_653_part_01